MSMTWFYHQTASGSGKLRRSGETLRAKIKLAIGQKCMVKRLENPEVKPMLVGAAPRNSHRLLQAGECDQVGTGLGCYPFFSTAPKWCDSQPTSAESASA